MMSLVRVQLEEFIWPLGQVVKTPPFHGDNMGSNPVGVIRKKDIFRIRKMSFFHRYKFLTEFAIYTSYAIYLRCDMLPCGNEKKEFISYRNRMK